MPLETGSIKPSVAFAPIAASTALPPRFKISTPTSVAAGTLVQTIPCRARTSDRVAKLFPVMRSIWPLSRRSTINRANSPRLTGLIQRTSQLTLCFQIAHLNSIWRLYLIAPGDENLFRRQKGDRLDTD